jgi:SEC-C motif-containing protein
MTAEELMRSRYSAHVRLDAEHLERTWQSATRPKRIDLDPEVTWLGLEVHGTERGQALDADGVVEFTATYERRGRRIEMREISRFARENGRWVYIDGLRPL